MNFSKLLRQSFVLLTTLLLGAVSNAAVVTLDTSQGELQGSTESSNENIRSFKGIPYALPPVGNRRWTHAEKATSWKGTRLATQFSPSCMQHPYPEGSFFSRPNEPISEDCLYLNVWSGAKAKEKLPVMVWIHGGGLTRGAGSTSAYDGAALAAKGVVLVTINYRLDVFGYFSHPELVDAKTAKLLSNFGTSDQVMALKWVQSYIEEYGGDPDNVTIFGESAGSFSVHHLMAAKQAKGLFHRAIGQSGSSLGAMVDVREKGNKSNSYALKMQKNARANSLQDLKNMDASDVLSAAASFRFRPVVDGNIFDAQIYELFEKGDYNSVPVMLGFNADEGTTLGAAMMVPSSKEKYVAMINKRRGDLAQDYLKIYPADNLYQSTMDAFRDGFVTWGMQSWAMMMANTDSDAYLYYFSFHPAGEKLGAYHAAEIVYAFDNVELVRDNAEKNHLRLADTMSDYWVSFAENGNPNSKSLSKWPAYTKEKRHYIEFNNTIESKKDLLPGVWEFYEKARLSGQTVGW